MPLQDSSGYMLAANDIVSIENFEGDEEFLVITDDYNEENNDATMVLLDSSGGDRATVYGMDLSRTRYVRTAEGRRFRPHEVRFDDDGATRRKIRVLLRQTKTLKPLKEEVDQLNAAYSQLMEGMTLRSRNKVTSLVRRMNGNLEVCPACNTHFTLKGQKFNRTVMNQSVCSGCASSMKERHGMLFPRATMDMLLSDRILNYGAKATEYFGSIATDSDKADKDGDYLLFGVELEVGCNESHERAVMEIKDTVGFVITKSDSSINNGFEIVSAPMTLNAHRKAWAGMFEADFVDDLELFVDSSHGMHVHVSRNMISPLTLGKMSEFINARRNRDFIKSVAGRDPWTNNYCRVDPDSKIKDILRGSGRSAVNLSPAHTVEIRIFAATTEGDKFFARLEFVAALLEYCKFASTQDLTSEGFLKWLTVNHFYYRRLSRWAATKGHIVTRHKPKPARLPTKKRAKKVKK